MIERLFESETTRWLGADTGGVPLWAWLALPLLVLLVIGKTLEDSNEKEGP